MSQVRKLKDGNQGIPKKTYDLILDGQTYTIDDTQLTKINNEIADLDPRYRVYLGGISNTIQSGDFVGSRTENTVSTSALTGLNDREINFLRKKKSNYWEALTDNNTYRAKEAINHALHIISNVVNSKKEEPIEEKQKTKIDKSEIGLEFNEKDGKKYLSTVGNYDARKRISDLIAHLQAGDSSESDYSAYDTDSISAWLNSLNGDDKYAAGNTYFDDLWTTMSKGDYKYDPEVEKLFGLFGIKYNLEAPKPKSKDSGTTVVTKPKDTTTEYKVGDITDDYNGNKIQLQENGTWKALDSTPQDSIEDTNKPTLITSDLVKSMGLDNKYLFGIIDVNGEKYTPEQIKNNRELSNLMAYVENINKQNMPQSERYKLISEKLNIPSIKNYTDWLPGTTIKGINLDDIFKTGGISSAAISEQTLDGFGDNRVIKYFNNAEIGTNPWGFRNPYYLVIGKDGQLHVQGTEEDIKALYGNKPVGNNAPSLIEGNWSPEKYNIHYTEYHENPYQGRNVPGTTTVYNVPFPDFKQIQMDLQLIGEYGKYRIFKDLKNRYYLGVPAYKKNSKKYSDKDIRLSLVSEEFVRRILSGENINDTELLNNITSNWFSPDKINSGQYIPAQKQGGTISKSKIEAFKQGRVIKGKDGTNLINIIQKDPTSNRRIERKSDGTILIIERTTDENGNIYETQTTLENPIPPEIAATVKRPLPSSTPLTKEEYSKVFPANTENQQKVVPNTPEETVTFIPNTFDIQHDSSSVTVPNTPLAKQDIVKVKTNDVKNFGDLVDVLKQLIKRHKSGGVIKAQWGLDTDELLKWKVPGWEITDQTPDWKQGSLYPEGMTPGVGYTTIVPGVLGMSDVDVTNGFSRIDMLTGKKYPKRTVNQDTDTAGGMDKILPDYTKYLLPAISLARFGINSHLQRKYRDTSKKAIEAARFNESPVVLNTPRNDNPALDRALQQVQSERMAGVKPVASDVIANNAIQNQREAQLYDREQNLVYQRSKADWEAKKEALNIMNQNIANQITTTNQNRARNASINSALYNPELEYIQRRGQSIENLGLEIQNNIKQDRNTMLNYAKQKEVERQTEILNRNLDSIFPGARAEYNALPFSEKSKYADLEEYLRTKYADTWSDNVEQIEKWRKDSANNMQRWLYLNGLNYSYPSFLTGKTPNIYKKGGYLRGKTRYTKEPDEQIWIDNNKATHAQIAKLTDATIKLLLRALK